MNKKIIFIMGPSGSGKSTLGNLLEERNNILIPKHCTTRKKRNDDKDGFYRYLNYAEMNDLYLSDEFLIISGDGPEIKEEYGNFYGVLKKDCLESLETNDNILLFVSYKDIEKVNLIKKTFGIETYIINLTFTDIELCVKNRLVNDIRRNHSENDINSRVKNAILDNEKYGEIVHEYADCTLYTDVLDIEKTYEAVSKLIFSKNKMLIKKPEN